MPSIPFVQKSMDGFLYAKKSVAGVMQTVFFRPIINVYSNMKRHENVVNSAIDNDEKILYYGGVMIDTLQIAKRLRENGLSQSAAEGLSEVFREFAANELATKNNLKQTEFVLQKEMQEIKTELQKEMQEIKTELQKEMQEIKTELQKEMQEIKAELQREMQEIKTELQKEIRALDIKIEKVKSQIIMWTAGFLIAQTALLFVLVRSFG